MSGIDIHIVAGPTEGESRVEAKGSVQHVIEPEDWETFRLSPTMLANGLERVLGKKPDDLFVRSPTPWDDLYVRHGWPQVKVIMNVLDAEILRVTSEPIILKTEMFENNSKTVAATFNVSTTDTVSNTVSSNWNTGGSIKVGQKFKYSMDILGTGTEAETSFEYTQTWGIGSSKSKQVTVGSTQGVSVLIPPGGKKKVELQVSRGVMEVRIRYKAHLTGDVTANYGDRWKGHHFYATGIEGVMGDVPNESISAETINIGYFSNANVILSDV